MSNSRLLAVVIILQGLILSGQWLGGGAGLVTPAQAQTADPARDRQQLLDEAKQTNAKLDKLIELLRSGELRVKVAQPDEARGAARGQ